MEEKLLKIFRLADELNDKQDKVYAEINYCANHSKILEISIRAKKNYEYIEKCEIRLKNGSLISWENIINLFETYVGGAIHE